MSQTASTGGAKPAPILVQRASSGAETDEQGGTGPPSSFQRNSSSTFKKTFRFAKTVDQIGACTPALSSLSLDPTP